MGYEDVWIREVEIRRVRLYIYQYGYYKMTFIYRFAGQLSGSTNQPSTPLRVKTLSDSKHNTGNMSRLCGREKDCLL